MTASKLEQRLAKLEGHSAEVAEPLNITVRFIEPGTMRVTSAMVCVDGEWKTVVDTSRPEKT